MSPSSFMLRGGDDLPPHSLLHSPPKRDSSKRSTLSFTNSSNLLNRVKLVPAYVRTLTRKTTQFHLSFSPLPRCFPMSDQTPACFPIRAPKASVISSRTRLRRSNYMHILKDLTGSVPCIFMSPSPKFSQHLTQVPPSNPSPNGNLQPCRTPVRSPCGEFRGEKRVRRIAISGEGEKGIYYLRPQIWGGGVRGKELGSERSRSEF